MVKVILCFTKKPNSSKNRNFLNCPTIGRLIKRILFSDVYAKRDGRPKGGLAKYRNLRAREMQVETQISLKRMMCRMIDQKTKGYIVVIVL